MKLNKLTIMLGAAVMANAALANQLMKRPIVQHSPLIRIN